MQFRNWSLLTIYLSNVRWSNTSIRIDLILAETLQDTLVVHSIREDLCDLQIYFYRQRQKGSSGIGNAARLINFQTYHHQNPSRFLHLSDDGSGGIRVLHEREIAEPQKPTFCRSGKCCTLLEKLWSLDMERLSAAFADALLPLMSN